MNNSTKTGTGTTTGTQGPVGKGNYVVKQGDCVESIAFKHGLFWETVWKDPKNFQLREARKNPNVLFPGDKVFVPDKRMKEESGATEQTHRFKRKGVPSKLHIVLKERDEPRADIPYIIEIDGKLFSGRTNSQGELEHPIPPNAKRGRLIVGESGQEVYPLQLGNIDPITEISGIQSRLSNLGFYYGSIDGNMNPETIQAIMDFQAKYDLQVTGEVDQTTRDKIMREYGG